MSSISSVPFNRFDFEDAEIVALHDLLTGEGSIAGEGKYCTLASELLSQVHGGADVLLTPSCTAALEMSALLLNLEEGDEVIVPSFTFVSTALAFLMFGAHPVFVDVRKDTLNLDEALVEASITSRTRAICVVNYGGLGAELLKLADIADKHGLVLIEDNAHGLGGAIDGGPLGTFGALSTLSFHETKNVSCGEGGALVVNDRRLTDRAKVLQQKGTNRSNFLLGMTDKYTWVDLGSSWVLSEVLASLLPPQLERLSETNGRRVKIWNSYYQALLTWADAQGFRLPPNPKGARQTGHLFHLRAPDMRTRSRFIEHLAQRDVSAAFHYQALHSSPMGGVLGYHADALPVSKDASETLVRLPLFRSLSDSELEKVIGAVLDFVT